MTLNVAGTALPVSNATPGVSLSWTYNPSPAWTDGQSVSLRLVGPSTPPPTDPEPEEEDELNVKIKRGSDRLHVTWNAVTGADKYLVQWWEPGTEDGQGYSFRRGVTVRGRTSHTITGLEPGTLYDLVVSASKDPVGNITNEYLSVMTEGEGTTQGDDESEDTPPRGGGGGVPSPQPPPPSAPQPPVQPEETPADRQPSPDREPLRALYQAAGGENWENKWHTDFPIDDWHGVRTNEDGRVTELDLSGNGLSGEIEEITEEIGELSYLETLDLSGNPELSGELPSGLMELEKLETLDIRDTSLCAPLEESFQDWLMGITFRGEDCAGETGDQPQVSGGGGCAVASGKEAGTGVGSALLGLLLVAFVLSDVLRKTASRPEKLSPSVGRALLPRKP